MNVIILFRDFRKYVLSLFYIIILL